MKTLPHLFDNNRAWAESVSAATRISLPGSRGSSPRGCCGPEIDSLEALAAARCDDAGWVVGTPG